MRAYRASFVAFVTACLLAGGGVVEVTPAAAGTEGIFVVVCGYGHRLPDDPIVKPAQPGASHSHDFFGNTSTDAFSTYESLRAGGTTCMRSADHAAYWVPTLYDNGVAVRPGGMSAYYTARGKPAKSIVPFPEGLRMVAGSANSMTPQQPMVTVWTCGQEAETESSSQVPVCATGTPLFLHVRFPDCWDGEHLDFTDHKSHMAYSMSGICPNGYPVAVPGLQINAAYPVRGGSTISLASGSAYTGHGDFFNAWDQAELSNLVHGCLNQPVNCGTDPAPVKLSRSYSCRRCPSTPPATTSSSGPRWTHRSLVR